MKKGVFRLRNGFTIIEVSLTLAIAGLIFLMVFVALPALRRSQRDSQRREDVLTFIETVKKYQQNNRGALPTGANNPVTWNSASGATDTQSWESFYKNYLRENFMDPNGENYSLSVYNCDGDQVDGPCKVNTIPDDVSFPNNYMMLVIKQATCQGSQVVATANPRKIAVQYRLEGAGVYCANS